nr:virulence factor SrfB [uncultured Hyphomonas sp.]
MTSSLKDLVNFEESIGLILDSGIQFIDLGLSIDAKKAPVGEFIKRDSKRSLARLEYDERRDIYFYPTRPGQAAKSEFSVPLDESLKLLEGTWLPIPYLRFSPPDKFAEGPFNWARARIIEVDPKEDPKHTHRVVIAFDTRAHESDSRATYLAPTMDDVRTGAPFRLAHRADQIAWFTEAPWIDAWIKEIFLERAQERLRISPEDLEEQIGDMQHQAHYLNFLHVLGHYVKPPETKIDSNLQSDRFAPIPVDFVLDVGNSRTCGILIEEHPQESDGLRRRYELELRDLTVPERTYARPFESRVEFAQANFGKDNFSVESGRPDAFQWPTIARVGPEAARLASRRRGTEGATGLSSPKRYLWDEEVFAPGWRFNNVSARSEIEPLATAAPFTYAINDIGEALYKFPPDERMPVFTPCYSRSSLMMFMLAEVIAQAIVQINSCAQRMKLSHANKPRHMRSIVLTVPPSMPKPERELFRERVRQAVVLVWKSLGWHERDADPDEDGDKPWPLFPEVLVEWDEASCGQVVYMFSEIQNNFSGHPEEFFRTMKRPDSATDDTKTLTVASIDIGGGTTDLVVCDYSLDDGQGANVFISPNQRFRDGFKSAGDEILLDVVRDVLVPAIASSLKAHGVGNTDALISRLIGSEALDARESTLRQQLTLQVLYPIGLRLLKEYEAYDPISRTGQIVIDIKDVLQGENEPSHEVKEHIASIVGREMPHGSPRYDIMSLSIPLNLRQLHENFLRGKFDIAKTIRSLSEIVYLYNCDVLLLTGRPSRLPGVQALLKVLLPLPPERIVSMQDYPVGSWYPFHRQGRIDDPKTTAAVGAVLCVLGRGRLPNFFFRSDAFKPYSTVKFIGLMDDNGMIKDADVYYRDVDLDDPDYELPDSTFEMRGLMRIGFRQLDAERWAGAPLYTLSFADDRVRDRIYTEGDVLQVRLKSESRRSAGGGNDRLAIAGVSSGRGSVGARAIKLQLNTLANVGIGETNYWLDSGSVV